MRVQICSMLLGYQKRYWWQLSSLRCQQPWEGCPVPEIRAVADISARDSFYGWSDDLLRKFDPLDSSSSEPTFRHLQIRWPIVDPPEADPFGRRGHIRSDNIRRAVAAGWADWLLFNDADMVYDPQFFSHLMTLVDPDEQRVYAAPRWSMSKEDGYRLVGSVSYRSPIENPADRLCQLVTDRWQSAGGRISGAGFFQLVSLSSLRRLIERDAGYLDYVPGGWNRDHNSLTDTHITRSDMKFRRRLGGIVPLPSVRPQYHINHYRKDDPQYDPSVLH